MNHLKNSYADLVRAGLAQATPCQQQQADGSEPVAIELRRIGGDVDRFVAAQKIRTGELAEKQIELQARLQDVERKQERPRGASDDHGSFGPSFGSQVEAAFADSAEMFKKTRAITLDVKAAITTVQTGGSHGSLDVPAAPSQSSTQLIALLNPQPLNGLTVLHYARRTGITGGAAVQDEEGAAKAVAEPIYTPIMQNAITIAGYATVSEQAMNSPGGLARAAETNLQKSVRDAADLILVAGTAATGWPWPGFVALAGTFTSGAGLTAMADTILSGIVRMRTQGFNPTIVVLPEAGFLGVMLAKSTSGEYLFLAALSVALGGARLALSAGVPAGKALLIDPSFAGVLTSGSTRVSIGYVNDQFTKNMCTIRAETEMIPYLSDYQGAMLATPAVA